MVCVVRLCMNYPMTRVLHRIAQHFYPTLIGLQRSMGLLSCVLLTLVSDRSYLRITAQEFTTLPLDIFLQAIISMFLTMYGILQIAGDFKEIRATVDLESKSWETLRNIPSFYTVNHRGRALSPEFDPASLKSQAQSLTAVSGDAVYS